MPPKRSTPATPPAPPTHPARGPSNAGTTNAAGSTTRRSMAAATIPRPGDAPTRRVRELRLARPPGRVPAASVDSHSPRRGLAARRPRRHARARPGPRRRARGRSHAPHGPPPPRRRRDRGAPPRCDGRPAPRRLRGTPRRSLPRLARESSLDPRPPRPRHGGCPRHDRLLPRRRRRADRRAPARPALPAAPRASRNRPRGDRRRPREASHRRRHGRPRRCASHRPPPPSARLPPRLANVAARSRAALVCRP